MLLIINNFIHHKNREGLEAMLKYLNIDFDYGYEVDISDDKYKIIYSPANPVNIHKYPKKFYIFGPHFCVLPTDNNKFDSINYNQNNLVYTLPCQWCVNIYKSYNLKINLIPFPFPVNTDKFNEVQEINKTEVLIYFKTRKPEDYYIIIESLKKKGVHNYVIFNYDNKYNENEFINHIHKSKYGIIVGRHESQGFAIQEMMSCNLPLLVWDVTNHNQEYGINYPPYPATSIPYWDDRCGEVFYESNEFDDKFDLFLSKLDSYKPRDYVMENLSLEVCANRFKELFDVGISQIDT
jgi:hypothetical protein